jgi:Toprim domain
MNDRPKPITYPQHDEPMEFACHMAAMKGGAPEDWVDYVRSKIGGPVAVDAAAAALGGEVNGGSWIVAPSPGRDPHDRSLIVRINDDGSYFVYAYEGAWWRVKAHVAAALGTVVLPPKPKSERTAAAMRLWEQNMPLGSLARKYLASRGILELPSNVDDVLRWHPSCPWGGGERRMAMVALFRDVLTDAPVAVHRTDIYRRERKALGPIRGAAVKLWPIAGDRLIVGEGIETVLSAATRLPYREPLRPAWAATVANNLAELPVVSDVQRLIILVDNDANGAGQRAAERCSMRWCDAGRKVMKLIPTKPDTDFNDLIIEEAQS